MCVACWAFNLTKDRHRKNVHYYYKTEKGLKKKKFIFGEEVIYMYANTIKEA